MLGGGAWRGRRARGHQHAPRRKTRRPLTSRCPFLSLPSTQARLARVAPRRAAVIVKAADKAQVREEERKGGEGGGGRRDRDAGAPDRCTAEKGTAGLPCRVPPPRATTRAPASPHARRSPHRLRVLRACGANAREAGETGSARERQRRPPTALARRPSRHCVVVCSPAVRPRASAHTTTHHPPQVLSDVRSIIAEQLGAELDTVGADAKFVDLGADSLDTVEIMMALEEKFEVTLDEEGAEGIATVQDAADMIAAKLG